MWAEVERFLYSEGYGEEEVASILARAIEQRLDPALIGQIIAMHTEREEAGSDHERASTLH